MKQVHVIPVPEGMTADEAWAEIRTFGRLVDHRWWHKWRPCTWTVVEVEDG